MLKRNCNCPKCDPEASEMKPFYGNPIGLLSWAVPDMGLNAHPDPSVHYDVETQFIPIYDARTGIAYTITDSGLPSQDELLAEIDEITNG